MWTLEFGLVPYVNGYVFGINHYNRLFVVVSRFDTSMHDGYTLGVDIHPVVVVWSLV